MAVDAIDFFNHMDSFLDYRKTSYDVSDQTLKSNLIDLTLFQRFIHSHRYKTISGLATMAFQFYLKKERDNSGGSINRKIYSLRSYSHFLRIIEVPDADRLPFYATASFLGWILCQTTILTTRDPTFCHSSNSALHLIPSD